MRLGWWWIVASGCPKGSEPPPAPDALASVVSVEASGSEGAYTFTVEIRSDETGCDQYADWWEVLTPEGQLVFRRILDHSHPDEQPFARSGGPVAVAAGDEVVVRAHLHPNGYVGAEARGTVAGGFVAWEAPAGFAAEVEGAPPQPAGCLF